LQVARLSKERPVKASLVLQTLSAIESRVAVHQYTNIADMSAVIDCLAGVVGAQVSCITHAPELSMQEQLQKISTTACSFLQSIEVNLHRSVRKLANV
jgi:hypothetical protein